MTGLVEPHVEPQLILTQRGCQAVLEGAEARARTLGLAFTIAIVDHGGHLLLFSRMDGVHLGTVDIAIAKARCALQFKRPTRIFAEALAAGSVAFTTLAGVTPLPGGIPLAANGSVVGAIGVSGAAPEQDEEVAAAGAAALRP